MTLYDGRPEDTKDRLPREIRTYDFKVEAALKGSADGTVGIRLAAAETVKGQVEDQKYAFSAPVPTFFEPQGGEAVLLFLSAVEPGLYRQAQEPFTIAVLPDGTAELRSNLLLSCVPATMRQQQARIL